MFFKLKNVINRHSESNLSSLFITHSFFDYFFFSLIIQFKKGRTTKQTWKLPDSNFQNKIGDQQLPYQQAASLKCKMKKIL